MALSIKNDATEKLARQVAKATGESLTEAIHRALEERWQQLKADFRINNRRGSRTVRGLDSSQAF